jgi:Skp family chaperone for outer membrane proteins
MQISETGIMIVKRSNHKILKGRFIMKKRWIAAVAALALIIGIGAAQAFAADETRNIERESKREAFVAGLTDEQKAQYEALHPERPERPKMDEAAMEEMKAKHEALVAALTDEQKTLYDAMQPKMPETIEGARPEKPDEAEMEAARTEMEAKREAFLASLTDNQKAEWEALMPFSFGGGPRHGGWHRGGFGMATPAAIES